MLAERVGDFVVYCTPDTKVLLEATQFIAWEPSSWHTGCLAAGTGFAHPRIPPNAATLGVLRICE